MVLEPQLRLATDVFLCEDGHAQERTLLASMLTSVQPHDLWIADRNMCTLGFVFGLQQRQAAFVIPQHGGLPYQALDQLHLVATSETGEVFEQRIELVREDQRIQLTAATHCGEVKPAHSRWRHRNCYSHLCACCCGFSH